MLYCKNEMKPRRSISAGLAELTCPPQSVIVSEMSTAIAYAHGVYTAKQCLYWGDRVTEALKLAQQAGPRSVEGRRHNAEVRACSVLTDAYLEEFLRVQLRHEDI